MKIFVPVTDDILDHPELLSLLVPYQAGVALAAQAGPEPVQSSRKTNRSPASTPSSEALPALSSSTYWAGPALG